MSYDPSNDPRYVPPPERQDEERVEELENAAIRLAGAVEQFEAMAMLFEQPGWAYLSQMLAHEQDTLDKAMRVECDPLNWKLLRGQKIQADWIVELPQEIADKLRVVRRHHEHVLAELRGNG